MLVILGALSAMALPALKAAVGGTKARLNKATMQEIKRAALAFRNDVGFVPDNVALLIYPYESCDVAAVNYDEANSTACKNLIAFVDSRLTTSEHRYANGLEGDYGLNMTRDQPLVDEIARRLDPKRGGWRGGYLGGNGHLYAAQVKRLGDGSSETNGRYFLSEKDVDLYYDGFDGDETLHYVGVTAAEAKRWYPVAADFNGSRGSTGTVDADARYDVAKYRGNLVGELTILDPWGTPYEIQFPQQSAVDAVYTTERKSRERFARIVSFGPDRRRDTDVAVLDVDYDAKGYDDSVLYVYEHNRTCHFHVSEAE